MWLNNNQNYKYQLWIIKFDKFTLYVFNSLAYNCEISKFLTTNTFLSFLKDYTSKKLLKYVYLNVL